MSLIQGGIVNQMEREEFIEAITKMSHPLDAELDRMLEPMRSAIDQAIEEHITVRSPIERLFDGRTR
jgi:hypothetical protein